MEGDSEVNCEEANAEASSVARCREQTPSTKQARYNCIFDCGLKDFNLVSLRDKEFWDRQVNAEKLHKKYAIMKVAAEIGDN